MSSGLICAAVAAACLMGRTVWAVDQVRSDPPYPRIANCYGAGLGWQSWERGGEYWSKLDLFIGGCYDLHYDWEHPRWEVEPLAGKGVTR